MKRGEEVNLGTGRQLGISIHGRLVWKERLHSARALSLCSCIPVLCDCSLGKVSYELDMGNAAKSDFTYLVILDVYNKTHEIGQLTDNRYSFL